MKVTGINEKKNTKQICLPSKDYIIEHKCERINIAANVTFLTVT